MSDDVCGYEGTATGEPCGNSATESDGRCWMHTTAPTDHDEPGAPSKLDEYGEQIIQAAKQGMSLAGCARIAGVAEQTLHDWKNEHPEFRERLLRARAQGELKHIQSVNESGSQFLLERSFGYTKTERREVDADHEHSGDLTVVEYLSGTDE